MKEIKRLAMKYEEVKEFLQVNSGPRLVNFTEYTNTSFGYKYPILEVENMYLYSYILENEFITRSQFEMYYRDNPNYERFCRYPYIRLVVSKTNDKSTEELYVLHLNQTFFTSGHQKLELKAINEDIDTGVRPWTDLSPF